MEVPFNTQLVIDEQNDGTINFQSLLPLLSRTVPILPEIWQGHKFGGAGFARAIKILKKIDPKF